MNSEKEVTLESEQILVEEDIMKFMAIARIDE